MGREFIKWALVFPKQCKSYCYHFQLEVVLASQPNLLYLVKINGSRKGAVLLLSPEERYVNQVTRIKHSVPQVTRHKQKALCLPFKYSNATPILWHTWCWSVSQRNGFILNHFIFYFLRHTALPFKLTNA